MANLLTNAAKYTPDGGHICVTAKPMGDSAILSVRDNGIGIAPEMLPRVFELFVQGEAGRDRDEGGLGIGLALVRKISEMHGGSVRVESAGKNRGSEFVITLPLEQPATARLQAGPVAGLFEADCRSVRIACASLSRRQSESRIDLYLAAGNSFCSSQNRSP